MEGNRDHAGKVFLHCLPNHSPGEKPSEQESVGLPASELEGKNPVLEYPPVNKSTAEPVQMPSTGNPMAAWSFAAGFDFESAIRAATLRLEPWQFFQASIAEERCCRVIEMFCTDHPAAFMAERRNQLLKPPTNADGGFGYSSLIPFSRVHEGAIEEEMS